MTSAQDPVAILAAIVESSVDAIISKTLDGGRITSWNAGAERLFGWTADEAIGQPITLIIPKERLGEEVEIVGRVRRGERVEHFETERIRKDGSLVAVSLSISPVRDPEGRIVGAAKIARDFTAEREARHELARLFDAEQAARAHVELLNDRLEDVLESMSDSLYEYDRDWRLIRMNGAGRKWFISAGVDPDACVGKVIWELFPGLDESGFGDGFRKVMNERVPVTLRARSMATSRWLQTQVYPTREGVAAYARDVDGEERAEARLRLLADAGRTLASHLDVQSTLETIARLVIPAFADSCTVDFFDASSGAIERVVSAHTVPEKEELWRLSARLNPNVHRRLNSDTLAALSAGKGIMLPHITPEQLVLLVPHEAQRAVVQRIDLRSYLVVPMHNADELIGAISFAVTESDRQYDADDLALAEELARRSAVAIENARLYSAERTARAESDEANRAKMQFLTTMSHELRTPLNAIAGYAQLLEIGIHGVLNDSQRDAISRIQRSERHLLGLINDVLSYARMEAGHVEYERRPLDVRDVMHRVVPLVESQLMAKGLRFEVQMPGAADPAVMIECDPDKTTQVLLNLLSNAIKFTDAGGEVAVVVHGEPSEVTIVVRDSGVGIPASQHEAIFEPFVQVDRRLTSNHVGTGLGLSISRDLARGMGGELVVRSEPGKGSEFELRLPAA
ncbi:MAG: sensor protein [Gemmatimonadetes bacterium]|nr:sensor protein [Gemmatimonadota bacterium]